MSVKESRRNNFFSKEELSSPSLNIQTVFDLNEKITQPIEAKRDALARVISNRETKSEQVNDLFKAFTVLNALITKLNELQSPTIEKNSDQSSEVTQTATVFRK